MQRVHSRGGWLVQKSVSSKGIGGSGVESQEGERWEENRRSYLSAGLNELTRAGHSIGWAERIDETKFAYWIPLQDRRGLCHSVHCQLASWSSIDPRALVFILNNICMYVLALQWSHIGEAAGHPAETAHFSDPC